MSSNMKLWTIGCAVMIISFGVPAAAGSITFTDADSSDTTKSTAAVVITDWQDASLNGECTVTYTQKGTSTAQSSLFTYNYDTPGNAGAAKGPFNKDGELEKTETFAVGDVEDLDSSASTENQAVPTDASNADVNVDATCSSNAVEFEETTSGEEFHPEDGGTLTVTCISTSIGGQSCSTVLG